MTRILAIDVTGPGGGAALLTPTGTALAKIPSEVRRGRSLVPLIEGLLDEAELRPEQLDCVACATGPGSFTGIRIGIATAATLAYAAGIPVLAVGSLHGIAAGAPADAPAVLVVLDARRGRVFAGRFPNGEYLHATPAEAVAGLPPEAFVLGEARPLHPEVFERFPGAADAPVRPDAIARIAAERFARGERLQPQELRPLYLRLSDPELKRML